MCFCHLDIFNKPSVNQSTVSFFNLYFVCFRLSLNLETSRKDINELKCQERKMLKQTELIRTALNELGCEEAPSGCDISIDNQPAFIDNSPEEVSVWQTTFCISFNYISSIFCIYRLYWYQHNLLIKSNIVWVINDKNYFAINLLSLSWSL